MCIADYDWSWSASNPEPHARHPPRLSARLLFENFQAAGQLFILEGTAKAHNDTITKKLVPSGAYQGAPPVLYSEQRNEFAETRLPVEFWLYMR
jgi:hypothetical protein